MTRDQMSRMVRGLEAELAQFFEREGSWQPRVKSREHMSGATITVEIPDGAGSTDTIFVEVERR